MNHASKPWLITPLLVCHAITCGAAEPALRIQPLETIRAAAAQAVRAAYADSGLHPVLIDASSLDPRLRLPACGAALQAQLLANAPGAARQVVIVRCETTSLWTVRVPTQLQTEISGLTLTRALSKGALVTDSEISTASRFFFIRGEVKLEIGRASCRERVSPRV